MSASVCVYVYILPLSPLVTRFQLTTLGSTELNSSRKNIPVDILLSWSKTSQVMPSDMKTTSLSKKKKAKTSNKFRPWSSQFGLFYHCSSLSYLPNSKYQHHQSPFQWSEISSSSGFGACYISLTATEKLAKDRPCLAFGWAKKPYRPMRKFSRCRLGSQNQDIHDNF